MSRLNVWRRRIPWRFLLAALALFLIVGLAAPLLSADRFGKRVAEALEASLGRKVKIGKVRFNLLGGPGFSVSDVEIGEAPAFGVETFAWVFDSLDARLQIKSLFTGKLAWSSLRLNRPMVNLVKVGDRWNFEPLLTPRLVAAVPRIEVREGRINFKFGDTKSIYYIDNVDLDAVARAGSDWDLRFSCEPSRTDRISPENGYRQSLTGRGRWQPDRVNFDLNVEKSALSEVSSLILGRDVGIHGSVASRIQLAGPLDNVRIGGRLQLQDIHRWDQMPFHGDAWALEFRGRLDVTRQLLEMESQSEILPVAVRYRVADYLSHPHWAVGLNWNHFPAEPLVEIARHMGAPLPEGVKLSGTLDGAVSWSGQDRLQGAVSFHDAAVEFPDSPSIHFDEATTVFDGDRIHLDSALARTAGSKATLEADYRLGAQQLSLDISSEAMTIAALRTQTARLPAPVLQAITSGVWSGNLRYQRGPGIEEGWSGQVQLSRVEIPLPGLAEPLHVRGAVARLDGAKLWVDKIVARAGAAEVSGDYRYEPGAPRPHRFRLTVPRIDAAALERLLMPTLRRDQGFFARTLGFGKPEVPQWLATRFMDGTIHIGALTFGAGELHDLRARIRWSGVRVDLLDAEARLENGTAYGRLTANLAARLPSYRLSYHLDSLDFNGGKVDADGSLETAGLGPELLSNVHAEGSFSGRELELCKSASGCYRLDWPRLRLTELQMRMGPDLYIGRGGTQEDGRLLFELSSGSRQMRVSGTLGQLTVE